MNFLAAIYAYRTCGCHFRRKIFYLPLFLLFFPLTIAIFPPGLRAQDIPAADLVSDNQPIDTGSKKYRALFRELINVHHFTVPQLRALFPGQRIDRTVLVLMDKQWESKPYYKYRPMFVTPAMIADGKAYLSTYASLFDKIENRYGVDREAIVAIWGVESQFGANQGDFSIFQTLNTLFAAYPRREEFYRKELINFLILCRKNSIDPLSIEGSYAGAFSQAQFMPSSFIDYAQDFDGDQKQDLIHSLPDIFASIANYLHQFQWRMNGQTYAELGPALRTPRLQTICSQGRLGRISWLELARMQNVAIPQPATSSDQLAIIRLEQAPAESSPFRYVAGYPNFIAITEYNHSTKYAMAISELIAGFRR